MVIASRIRVAVSARLCHRRWANYGDHLQSSIDEMHEQRREVWVVDIDGWGYTINFVQMIQISSVTGTRRQVRSLTRAVPAVLSMMWDER